jgi:hypothetical protein
MLRMKVDASSAVAGAGEGEDDGIVINTGSVASYSCVQLIVTFILDVNGHNDARDVSFYILYITHKLRLYKDL